MTYLLPFWTCTKTGHSCQQGILPPHLVPVIVSSGISFLQNTDSLQKVSTNGCSPFSSCSEGRDEAVRLSSQMKRDPSQTCHLGNEVPLRTPWCISLVLPCRFVRENYIQLTSLPGIEQLHCQLKMMQLSEESPSSRTSTSPSHEINSRSSTCSSWSTTIVSWWAARRGLTLPIRCYEFLLGLGK